MKSLRRCFSTLITIALPCLATVAAAQGLAVRMSEVDFSGLPRVSLKLCTTLDGQLLPGLDSSNFTFRENGALRPLAVRCPDATRFNSVMLILDNSGSMENYMPKLIEAAGRLVDSLDANDECAILTFGRSISLRQDFTTDRTALKAALATLTANNGTALFDASMQGLQRLATRAGNRYAVIITDGEDNMSSATENDVIALAQASGARLYTIAFMIELAYQRIMERMALETGGAFFRVERSSDLPSVYERIASEITEKCCLAIYESDRCADTLRLLEVTLRAAGDSASDALTVGTPSRADSTRLILDVPAQLTPLSSGDATVRIDPPLSTELEVTLRFTVTFDPDLVDIAPLPFTLGSIAQNGLVVMTKTGPGRMRIAFNRIHPPFTTDLLVGFPVRALVTDSSRRAAFGITDVELEGCPTVFGTTGDTTTICQCLARADAMLDSAIYLPLGSVEALPLRIRGGLAPGVGLLGRVLVEIPSAADVVDVVEGSLLPPGSLHWSRPAPDRIELAIPASVPPRDTAGVLAEILLRPRATDRPAVSELRVLEAAFWQHCCITGAGSSRLVADGRCAGVVLRPSTPVITVTPHPVVSGCSAAVTLTLPDSAAAAPLLLDLLDLQGRPLRTIASGMPAAGRHVLPLPDGLAAGTYLLRLRTAQGMTLRLFTVIR